MPISAQDVAHVFYILDSVTSQVELIQRHRVMEGIIGRWELSDGFMLCQGSQLYEDRGPYLFHAHFIQVAHVFYHLVPVDLDECHYLMNKKR